MLAHYAQEQERHNRGGEETYRTSSLRKLVRHDISCFGAARFLAALANATPVARQLWYERIEGMYRSKPERELQDNDSPQHGVHGGSLPLPILTTLQLADVVVAAFRSAG